jgi:hypothetical protein
MKTLQNFIVKVIKEELENQRHFNVAALSKLKTITEIENYCRDTLGKPSGYGSGRIVWVIDQDTIIKVARYQPSKQNEKEFERSLCIGSEYAVQVIDYDINGFKWLIEERVETFKTDNNFVKYMNKKLGFEFEDYFQIVDMFSGFYYMKNIRDELLKANKWLKDFLYTIQTCNMSSHDFHPGNWGVRLSTGELILIDLGF